MSNIDDVMDVRTYAAVAAMQSIIAAVTEYESGVGIIRHRPRDIAELAVIYADTLMDELDRG